MEGLWKLTFPTGVVKKYHIIFHRDGTFDQKYLNCPNHVVYTGRWKPYRGTYDKVVSVNDISCVLKKTSEGYIGRFVHSAYKDGYLEFSLTPLYANEDLEFSFNSKKQQAKMTRSGKRY